MGFYDLLNVTFAWSKKMAKTNQTTMKMLINRKNSGPLAVALCLCLLPISFEAFAKDYPLSCRGPINYSVGKTIVGDYGNFTGTMVYFKKNANKAGLGGANLSPGTCAWADRPLAKKEPAKISLKEYIYKKFRHGRSGESWNAYNNPAYDAFINCAGNKDCVFVVDVSNYKNKYLRGGTKLRVLYGEDLEALELQAKQKAAAQQRRDRATQPPRKPSGSSSSRPKTHLK